MPINTESQALVIGLVNMMPSAARRATRIQFSQCLSAAGGRPVSLRLFTAVRTLDDARAGDDRYEEIAALWPARLDGLIVTGTVPQAGRMVDEPYWPMLEQLIGWAEQHTISTLWSCFAAHAAVFGTDRIERLALARKLSGIYQCGKRTGSFLTAAMPAAWPVPHSRQNTLDEAALRDAGYTILSGSDVTGPDMFTKICGDSRFLYCQGHPEYGPRSLIGEYSRDVRRFFAGDTDRYPQQPENHFPSAAAAALDDIARRASHEQPETLLAALDAVLAATPDDPWRGPATTIFGNWLDGIAIEKSRRTQCHAQARQAMAVAP